MNHFKVVATFSFTHEAHIAKMNLESVGINSHIADEHTINMQWLYSNAMGGVRLFVSEEDFDTAMEILNSDEPMIICDENFDNVADNNIESDSLRSSTFMQSPAVVIGFNFLKWCCVLLAVKAIYHAGAALSYSGYINSLNIFLYFAAVPLVFAYILHKYHRK